MRPGMKRSRSFLLVSLFLGCALPRPPGASSPLLNPTLMPLDGQADLKELRPFKRRLAEYSDQAVAEGKASHVSVYFRDLWNGPVFGLNEKEPFTPGSLLKLPIMIAVLKQAQSDPGLLMKEVVFKGGGPEPAYGRASRQLEEGKTYTVDALLSHMISYSDNRAMRPLVELLDQTEFQATYFDLGLLIPMVRSAEVKATVQEYSALYRILYNAAYLSRGMSARALRYLDDTDFDAALASGVPKDVRVAHKFGEHFDPATGVTQLHDCGIVYHPRRHYLLCVMTRGGEFKDLVGVIGGVSKLVYEEVDAQTKR